MMSHLNPLQFLESYQHSGFSRLEKYCVSSDATKNPFRQSMKYPIYHPKTRRQLVQNLHTILRPEDLASCHLETQVL